MVISYNLFSETLKRPSGQALLLLDSSFANLCMFRQVKFLLVSLLESIVMPIHPFCVELMAF